jgi:predicted CopG family antitoxin
MSEEDITTIRVHKETADRIGKQGTAKDSMEDVIKRLLDRAEGKVRGK